MWTCRPAAIAAVLFVVALGAHAQLKATPAQAEGPYYRGGSPERETLYGPADDGKRVVVTGRVLDRAGNPVARGWIDVWQTNAAGQYDNLGYGYRGHLYTDSSGRYTFRTVVPGEYPGRTPHIHVKVRAGQGPVLTTQIYFPEFDKRNQGDGIYQPALVVRWDADGTTARFDFVLP